MPVLNFKTKTIKTTKVYKQVSDNVSKQQADVINKSIE